MLAKLVRTEYQPAYLFHAPPQLGPGESPAAPYLAGKHQRGVIGAGTGEDGQ